MFATNFKFSLIIIHLTVVLSTTVEVLEPFKYISSFNSRPVIGVLAQEIIKNGVPVSSYIAASYVKFAESGGAQVAPILMYQSKEYLDDLFSKLNGLILPGGDVTIPGMEACPVSTKPEPPGDYASTGSNLLSLARKANEAGEYFPVWGECLGMELMMVDSANGGRILEKCDGWNISLPLNLTPGAIFSKLMRKAPPHILHHITTLSINPHWHTCCVTPESIRRLNLDSSWNIVATNKDRNGLLFSSLLEHRKYPFYGLGFHPEKTVFEWHPYDNIVHNTEATEAAQFFARFLVNEARKSKHKFDSMEDETKHLIYQHQTTYTGVGSGYDGPGEERFIQRYFFPVEIETKSFK